VIHASAAALVAKGAEGEDERVKRVEAEIDDLLREKEEVEKWATLGSA
jgi:hypothetical protein